jgi:hypothetical protein
MAGSRMTARGMVNGWRSISLTWVAVLVTPAFAENSPPAIVVGTLIWRTAGGFMGGATPLTARTRSMPSTDRTPLARQICTALAPSVIEPPPTVTMRSAAAARACSAAATTASRGVCCGIASNTATQRGPSAWRIFSISSVSRSSVPETIRKAREAASRSICPTIAAAAGRPNTTSSIAPKTTRPCCTRLSSRDNSTRQLDLILHQCSGANRRRHARRWLPAAITDWTNWPHRFFPLRKNRRPKNLRPRPSSPPTYYGPARGPRFGWR